MLAQDGGVTGTDGFQFKDDAGVSDVPGMVDGVHAIEKPGPIQMTVGIGDQAEPNFRPASPIVLTRTPFPGVVPKFARS